MHVLTSFQGANETHLTKDESKSLENKSTWTLFEQFGLYAFTSLIPFTYSLEALYLNLSYPFGY